MQHIGGWWHFLSLQFVSALTSNASGAVGMGIEAIREGRVKLDPLKYIELIAVTNVFIDLVGLRVDDITNEI